MKPHIVHIIGNLSVGGITNLIQQIATHPALAGYRHSLIAIKSTDLELLRSFQLQGISVFSCPIIPRQMFPFSYRLSRWLSRVLQIMFPYRLSRLLKQLDANIIHTHSFSTQNVFGQALGIVRLARLPWVWTVHGFFEIPSVEIEKWRSSYEIAQHGKLRITADSNYLSQLVKAEVLHGAKINVVYPGIDTSMFGRAEPNLEWRARHGIPASAVLFGSTGRLAYVKGFDVLIRAASHLIQTRSNAYFVIAGSGELMDELQKLVAANGISDRFKLLGFQEDLPFYLAQLDVFVLSSRSEGFPLSLLEALASGLPCIGTKVGGVPEMLELGIVVPPEDPQALAQAMAYLLDSAPRQSFASHSQEIVGHYSMDRCGQEFKKIYDDLLSF